MTQAQTPPGLGTGLPLHLVGNSALLVAVAAVWDGLGRPLPIAFWAAVAVPVVHQVYVWLCWRLELRSAATSRAIGFGGYVAAFFVLFGARPVTLATLAWLDRGSLGLPMPAIVIATLLLAVPALYASYSVGRYFGMRRAAGADHFDPSFRELPRVTQGIFRWTRNGMYVYAFLTFWAIAVGFNSMSALVVAGFSHASIWIHYFATEKPDMAYLYGED